MSNPTERAARMTGISARQIDELGDYCEALARRYLAAGMSGNAAIEAATDETMRLARSLGMLGEVAS